MTKGNTLEMTKSRDLRFFEGCSIKGILGEELDAAILPPSSARQRVCPPTQSGRGAPCAEPATAAAAAARAAERTPPASKSADAAPAEAPLSARTRNSLLRLAAQAQVDATAEGGRIVATAKAVKLLSAEELELMRAAAR